MRMKIGAVTFEKRGGKNGMVSDGNQRKRKNRNWFRVEPTLDDP